MKRFLVVVAALGFLATSSHAQPAQPTPPSTPSAPAPSPSTAPAATSTTPSGPAPAPARVHRPSDNCVQNNKHDIDVELRSGLHPVGPELFSTTFFLPAGGSGEVALDEPYKEGSYYFGFIETKNSNRLLGRSVVKASRIPDDHRLVTKGVVEKGSTLLTLQLPDSMGDLWRRANLYVYTCGTTGSPRYVSQLSTRVSSSLYSGIAVWGSILIIYGLAALAACSTGTSGVRWYRYFDPVYLTAGVDGKGSISKLQVLFFTLIVAGLLAYIVARTGVLSDLSITILMLMGIAGIGSAAAKGTDLQRNRIEPENAAWLAAKGWLPKGGLNATNTARWRDIVTSDGEFDVYRYQTVIFSIIVGLSLLAAGIAELSSFTIPQTLLGILGLSQVIYIGGKLVTPTSLADLNTSITELRNLEKAFVVAAARNVDPTPDAPGDALAVARRRAAEGFADYMKKAETARIQFESATGISVDPRKVQPSLV